MFPSEKIKTNLNRENTQEGEGELEFKKFFFKHNKLKHKKHIYKEIRLEKVNSNFIIVFLAYIHSPKAPNRVRVPLYLKFHPSF